MVLKRKQEILYVPLDFEKNLTTVVLIDLEACVCAIAQNELVTKKLKAPSKILKIDDIPNFQIEVSNGQLVKSLATATFKFEYGDKMAIENINLKLDQQMKKVILINDSNAFISTRKYNRRCIH